MIQLIREYFFQNLALKLVWGIYPRRKKWILNVLRLTWPTWMFPLTVILVSVSSIWIGAIQGYWSGWNTVNSRVILYLIILLTKCWAPIVGILLLGYYCLFPSQLKSHRHWKPELSMTQISEAQIRFAFLSPAILSLGILLPMYAILIHAIQPYLPDTHLFDNHIHIYLFIYFCSILWLTIYLHETQSSLLARAFWLLLFTAASPTVLLHLNFMVGLSPQPRIMNFGIFSTFKSQHALIQSYELFTMPPRFILLCWLGFRAVGNRPNTGPT